MSAAIARAVDTVSIERRPAVLMIRAPLPAVVAVADSINTPRYPSLKGIMGAKKKPQETLAAGEVGGAEDPGTSVVALNPPPERGEARRIEDEGTAAEQVVEFLAEKRLL